MQVKVNHTEAEVADLSKGWATLFICAAVIVTAISIQGPSLLHSLGW